MKGQIFPRSLHYRRPLQRRASLIEQRLNRIKGAGLWRELVEIEPLPHGRCRIGGREFISLCSNDYLGLAANGELIGAYGKTHGAAAGSTGSRLLSGTHPAHSRLERRLAELYGAEAALIFNSGYHANTGIIPALTGPGSLIFSDELNHASIIDGCRLSRAKVVIFRHNDPEDLRRRLLEARQSGQLRDDVVNLLITEGVFSMEGDIAHFTELRKLCDEFGLLFYMDDAHGFGVFGGRGLGVTEDHEERPDILVATFGKAAGLFGAFVVCDEPLKELILNSARTFIYSTALPPPLVSAAASAVELIVSDTGERLRLGLHHNRRHFVRQLLDASLEVISTESQIVPVRVGGEQKAVLVSGMLYQRGIFARAIRYPTVPLGEARVRFSISAAHREEDLDFVVSALCEAMGDCI